MSDTEPPPRAILHVDMDAFYASVEERENPSLRGTPVVVGGSKEGRGVVCAANYEARKFGVHSAMSAARAVKLCPQATFIRPRMDLYASVSREIRACFHRVTPLVQPLSLDEAFLDVTGSRALLGPADGIGRRVKQDVLNKTGLIASVGVAPNKYLAKIASDLDKPDGFTVVDPDRVQEFLDPLDIGRVWGVGKAARRQMDRLGVATIGDVRRLPEDVLRARFGSWGEQLWRLARGIDDRPVTPDRESKSVSHETTFRENVTDAELLRAWAAMLAEQVARRVRRSEMKGRTVQVKLRHADFRTLTRAATLPEPTDVTRIIADAAGGLVDEFTRNELLQHGRLSVRLLGVGVTNFDRTGLSQGTLFGDVSGGVDEEREHRRDVAVDAIAEKFGTFAVKPGSALELPKKERANPYEGQ